MYICTYVCTIDWVNCREQTFKIHFTLFLRLRKYKIYAIQVHADFMSGKRMLPGLWINTLLTDILHDGKDKKIDTPKFS